MVTQELGPNMVIRLSVDPSEMNENYEFNCFKNAHLDDVLLIMMKSAC